MTFRDAAVYCRSLLHFPSLVVIHCDLHQMVSAACPYRPQSVHVVQQLGRQLAGVWTEAPQLELQEPTFIPLEFFGSFIRPGQSAGGEEKGSGPSVSLTNTACGTYFICGRQLIFVQTDKINLLCKY